MILNHENDEDSNDSSNLMIAQNEASQFTENWNWGGGLLEIGLIRIIENHENVRFFSSQR